MLSEVLTLGDKIDIKPLDKAGKPHHNARTFVSQLVDFVDSDIINISAPIVLGRAMILGTGEYFNLCFYTNRGLYQCNCIVLSSHRDNNTIVIVVRITTNLEKYQRRQYYRLECLIDIEYRVIRPEEEMLQKKLAANDFKNEKEREECKEVLNYFESDWIKATVMDLSGGGARFNSSVNHNLGDKVRILLNLSMSGDSKRLALTANIIASSRNIYKNNMIENRVEFIEIKQRDREELIKFIFEQDRKRRGKEK